MDPDDLEFKRLYGVDVDIAPLPDLQEVPLEEECGGARLHQVALPSHSVELMAITPTFILPPPGLSKPAAVVPVGMAAVTSEPLPEHDASYPTHSYVPSKTPWCGEVNFKMSFDTSAVSHGKSWAYCPKRNTVHVKKNSEFVIGFSFQQRPAPGCELWGLVCFKDSETFLSSPPIAPLSSRPNGSGSPFLKCHHAGVKYAVLQSHLCLGLDVDSLPVCKEGCFAVFSCPCYSRDVLTVEKKRTDMVLIFSLFKPYSELPVILYEEIARDVVTLKCVSTPSRLLPPHSAGCAGLIAGASPLEAVPQAKRRKAVCACVQQPDKDGYYHFTWDVRIKDREEFMFLQLLKQAYTKRQQ